MYQNILKKKITPAVWLLVLAAAFAACQFENFQQKIDALEQAVTAHPTPRLLDSLANTCHKAAKASGTSAAEAARYLTRAAELRYQNADLAGAAQELDDLLTNHPAEADMTAAVGLLAGVYGARLHLEDPTKRPSDEAVRKMTEQLRAHPADIDSAVARVARKIVRTPDAAFDAAMATQYVDMSEGYADLLRTNNPTQAGEWLFSAAGAARELTLHERAIQLYTRLSDQLADHPKAPTALFLAGFIYENDLSDMANAKTVYETFLKRYPTNADYADDARMALKNLGKSPEELIREFEQKQ